MADASPFTYAYRYPAHDGKSVIRFGTGGREINGAKPIEAIPLYRARQPQLPDDGLIKALEGIRVDLIDARRIMRSFGHDSICLKDALDKVEALSRHKAPLSDEMEICDACGGAGGDNQHSICGKCDGAGGYRKAPLSVAGDDVLIKALERITDKAAEVRAGDLGYDESVEEMEAIAREALSKHKAPLSVERTPYCPNCGESCLDKWHSSQSVAGDDMERLREAVEHAAHVFRCYAELHDRKGTNEGREKARRNMEHAELMEAALHSKQEGEG